MRTDELLENLKPRLQRLGLVDPLTGFYDQDEVLFYVQAAMRYLANRYQLQHFMRINREFLRTVANVESYTMPPTYGFWSPEETRRSGLAVSDTNGTNQTNLFYYDVARYNLLRTAATTGRPAWFTVADSLIYFQPTPDATYVIEAIERPIQGDTDIPDAYAEGIGIETLWRFASDLGKATPVLIQERTEILRTLVNGEARQRQRFYTSHERPGFNRGRRRYGY